MCLLIAGLVVFLGVHSIAIVSPRLRDMLRTRAGAGAWRGIYSVVSLVGFVMICKSFALTRLVPGLKLFDIKCAWFNENCYNEFFPRLLLPRPKGK